MFFFPSLFLLTLCTNVAKDCCKRQRSNHTVNGIMQIGVLLKSPFEVVNGDYGNGSPTKALGVKIKRQQEDFGKSVGRTQINK